MTAPSGSDKKHEALGGKVSRGMSWMVIATIFGKAFSFITTFILGILLTESDYAVYGIAMGIAAFAQVLRDGGMRQVLIQKQAHRYKSLSGPVFWLSAVFNGTAGLLLAAAAWPIAALYSEPQLAPVLLATAISIILTTPLGVYRAKMAVDLHYRRLAELNTTSAFVRYTFMILFALLGFGPLAFTLPLVVRALYEAAFGYHVTKDKPWTRPPRRRLWPALWAKSKWLVFGTFAMSTLRQGDYLVLGWLKIAGLLTLGVVGQYVFAYQIAVQINVLVAVNLQSVLFPALSKLAKEPQRHARAVLRATRVMMLVGCGFGLALATTFEPLQTVLWNHKWAGAVAPVMWMAAFFPMRLLTSVLNSAQMSKGRFKEWFWLTLVQGTGMMLAAAFAGSIFNTAGQISLIIGIYFALGVAPTVVWGLSRVGVPVKPILAAIIPTWLIAAAAASATLVIVAQIQLPTIINPRATAAVEVLIRGSIFSLLYLFALRTITPAALAETIDIAPKRIARPVKRILRLKPAPA
jgi:O-antigen/teichoic acid export membrane protein